MQIDARRRLCLNGLMLFTLLVLCRANADVYDPRNMNERKMEDEVVYFVLPDRFYNGDQDNDLGGLEGTIYQHSFNPSDTGYYHGGDLKGLQQKLDYIQQLGITAIWMSPVLKNLPLQVGPDGTESAAYHGYWTIDFTQIDPHFGSNQDLQHFVDEAHRRGIKVLFDVITNHTADIIKFRECHNAQGQFLTKQTVCPYRSLEESQTSPYTPFVPEAFANIKKPTWLNDISVYHNQGDTTFAGEDALNGDFEGMDDLNTEDPRVVKGMVEIFKHWIDAGIDGFRIDTVRNVNIGFWREWAPQILDYAKQKGKPNFFMFGEVYDYSVENRSEYMTVGNLPSVFDFSFQGVVRSVISNGQANEAMHYLFSSDDYYIGAKSSAGTLVNFVGNHDMGRFAYFLRKDLPEASEAELIKRFKLAHAFMFFARGVPVIYYGDEQGFVGDGEDRDAREDMLASQTESFNDNDLLATDATTAEANFDRQHPLYLSLKKYIDVFKSETALRRGKQFERYYDDNDESAGIYAFSRVIPEEGLDYLVVFNTANQAKQVSLDATGQSYRLVYQEDPAELTRQQNNQVEVSLAPLSFAIWKSQTALEAVDLSEAALSFTGVNRGDVISARSRIEVTVDGLKPAAVDLAKIEFSYHEKGSTEEIQLGADWSAPYRIFWTPTGIDDGTQVELTATLVNTQGLQLSQSIDLVVDRRIPDEISLHYQNGNRRTQAFAISDQGAFRGPLAVEQNQIQLPWGDNDAAQFVVFESFDVKTGRYQFDRPFLVERSHLVQGSHQLKDGGLKSDIFVNNLQQLTKQEHAVDQALPPTLTHMVDPLEQPFFLRGSMNGWAAVDQMLKQADGSYAATRLVKMGGSEFKFSDANWTAFNLGGAYGKLGLVQSDNPANLNDIFVRDELFEFRLFTMSDEQGLVYRFHHLQPVPGPLAKPVALEYLPKHWKIKGDLRFAYLDKNKYQLKVRIEQAGTYALKMDGIAVSDNKNIKVDQKVAVSTGESDDLTIAVEHPGSYIFSLDAKDLEHPSLLVYEDTHGKVDLGPYAKTLYLRGSMNGWSTSLPMGYSGAKRYSLVVYLSKGTYQFKLADESWGPSSNIGGDASVAIAQEIELDTAADSGNLSMTLVDDGVYQFTLFAANKSKPLLTLEELHQVIIHYYLPTEQRWETEFVDLEPQQAGFETWYIESLGTTFASEQEALAALDASEES
ncbi:alpha-amylase family glycosyl hydrolase [Agarivorans sp. QJM3NY_25]|uniref:alpha-amylase family glycosyl hydrolase n=1 Tax=Agarivorans sp. QJM3NY_25 TaxID=3421430 RepID=UPI003D7E244F